MSCAAIMTVNPTRVRETDTIGWAAETLIEHRYINLPVVDEEARLIGLFGIFDLLALLMPRVAMVGGISANVRFVTDDSDDLRASYRHVRENPVGRAMNREAPFVHPDTSLGEAIRLFCRAHTTLPVVERGSRRLLGIVSYWDAIGFVSSGR